MYVFGKQPTRLLRSAEMLNLELRDTVFLSLASAGECPLPVTPDSFTVGECTVGSKELIVEAVLVELIDDRRSSAWTLLVVSLPAFADSITFCPCRGENRDEIKGTSSGSLPSKLSMSIIMDGNDVMHVACQPD
jgi:hypothetical protein